LRNQILAAVRRDSHHAAAGVGNPEHAVRLGENAFGPLQIVTNVAKIRFVDTEIEHRVRIGGKGLSHDRPRDFGLWLLKSHAKQKRTDQLSATPSPSERGQIR
jgi:hypothetical protein